MVIHRFVYYDEPKPFVEGSRARIRLEHVKNERHTLFRNLFRAHLLLHLQSFGLPGGSLSSCAAKLLPYCSAHA